MAVRHSRRKAEVAARLASGPTALHQHSLLTLRRAERQLVERDDLAAGFEDAGTGLLGEAEGANLRVKSFDEGGMFCANVAFQLSFADRSVTVLFFHDHIINSKSKNLIRNGIFQTLISPCSQGFLVESTSRHQAIEFGIVV